MRGFHLHHQTCTCNLAGELGFGKPSFLSKRAESGLLEHSVGKYPKKDHICIRSIWRFAGWTLAFYHHLIHANMGKFLSFIDYRIPIDHISFLMPSGLSAKWMMVDGQKPFPTISDMGSMKNLLTYLGWSFYTLSYWICQPWGKNLSNCASVWGRMHHWHCPNWHHDRRALCSFWRPRTTCAT